MDTARSTVKSLPQKIAGAQAKVSAGAEAMKAKMPALPKQNMTKLPSKQVLEYGKRMERASRSARNLGRGVGY